MADLVVRKDSGGPLAPRSEWNPARLIRDLMQWDPFRELAPSFSGFPNIPSTFTAAFEVKETNGSYVCTADLPGIEEKDLDITVSGNRITVSGKRELEREDQSHNYYVSERSYGSFSRSFTLPEGIDADHIQAQLGNGVLSIVIPKTSQAQTKKISLKSNVAKKS